MSDLAALYGSVRDFNGSLFVLEGTSQELRLAREVAEGHRREGRKSRVTSVGKRGVKDNSGNRRTNCYAIWTCWE
jgi:hypothetical protein